MAGHAPAPAGRRQIGRERRFETAVRLKRRVAFQQLAADAGLDMDSGNRWRVVLVPAPPPPRGIVALPARENQPCDPAAQPEPAGGSQHVCNVELQFRGRVDEHPGQWWSCLHEAQRAHASSPFLFLYLIVGST